MRQSDLMKRIKLVKSSLARLDKKVQTLTTELEGLQAKCLHKNVKTEHGGNTGNYDPTSDIYWTETTCLDCGFEDCKYTPAHKW